MSDVTDTPTLVSRREFRSMGTACEVLLRAEPQVATPVFDAVQRELARLEAIFTRFDPASPIEQLNDAGYGLVDGPLREVLELSLAAHRDTGGRVDVGIGADLIKAGYDRDFDELDVPDDPVAAAGATRAQQHAPVPPPHAAATRPAPFEIDDDGVVQVPEGVRIDLGGIAKGWAADAACRILERSGSCLVNLGGDIALHVEPGDEPWPVGVDLGDRIQSYALAFGAVATSGQDRRVWRVAGSDRVAHHVIDPRTGEPALTDMLRITVIADSCAQAEIWTKALFLQGCDAAVEEADQRGITAIIVGLDGEARLTGMLA